MTERKYRELMKDEQLKSKVASMIKECGKPIPQLAREADLPILKVYQLASGAKPGYISATKISKALNITLEKLLGQN